MRSLIGHGPSKNPIDADLNAFFWVNVYTPLRRLSVMLCTKALVMWEGFLDDIARKRRFLNVYYLETTTDSPLTFEVQEGTYLKLREMFPRKRLSTFTKWLDGDQYNFIYKIRGGR